MPPAPARCASAPRAAVLQSHPWVPVRSGGMSQHRGRGVTQKLFRSLWFFFHGLAVTELLASCAASRQVLAHRAPMAFRPPCGAVMHTLIFFFTISFFPPRFLLLVFLFPKFSSSGPVLFLPSAQHSVLPPPAAPQVHCQHSLAANFPPAAAFFFPKSRRKINKKKKIHTPPNPNQLLLAETSTSSLGSQQSTPLRSGGARGFMPEGLLKLCQKSSFFRAACGESKAFCFTFCCDVWGGRLLGAG